MTNDAGNAAQWHFPDSDICSAAMQLAFDVSPEFLANHCVRSYIFARELAAAKGLRSGVDYDDELVFLSCILHDLGVTDYGDGDQRFEVDGSDGAARLLRDQGISDHRVTTVWQTIALHTRCRLGGPIGPRTIRLGFRNQPGHQRYRDGTSLTRLRRTGPRCMATPQSGLRNRRSDRPRHTSQPDEGSPLLVSSPPTRTDKRSVDHLLRCGGLGRPTLERITHLAVPATEHPAVPCSSPITLPRTGFGWHDGRMNNGVQARSLPERRAAATEHLRSNTNLWLATASDGRGPHLIPASFWWDGARLTTATFEDSRTLKNVQAQPKVRASVG